MKRYYTREEVIYLLLLDEKQTSFPFMKKKYSQTELEKTFQNRSSRKKPNSVPIGYKRKIKSMMKGNIGGLNNACVPAAIQHSTDLPDHVVMKACYKERNKPLNKSLWTPHTGMDNNTRNNVLKRLGHKVTKIQTNGETVAELARKHPEKNLIVNARFHHRYANGSHAFNVKQGKLYDRYGIARHDTIVSSASHVEKTKQLKLPFKSKKPTRIRKNRNNPIGKPWSDSFRRAILPEKEREKSDNMKKIMDHHHYKRNLYANMKNKASEIGNKELENSYKSMERHHDTAHQISRTIYRSILRRHPEMVKPYEEQQKKLSENAVNRESKILNKINNSEHKDLHNRLMKHFTKENGKNMKEIYGHLD